MKPAKKKRKFAPVSRDETKVAMGSEYDFPPHIASIQEELWSYTLNEGTDSVGLRLVRDKE